MGIIIREVDKGRGEVIRVEVSEYKGTKYLNLRIWYTDKDGEKKPTQKGIAIPPELYDEIKKAIIEAENEVKS
ncbi:transcriptional coactivator p15/PC4 family protein [Leptospira alexanderi]|uniref:Transcriptional Coactivator p15 n=1 Tax=Leptospira alexanderi serovar Manhao 3 str. L 60 TaxID=1049759 RepID=V6HUL9_9LEPT|nr:transcriptional coactivator p15/PC4 family protein [Leptospira alexanderi]EQA60502.1 transcriptional Coactivator p15 [Leptospira alexanderi serovar Manhao 3 str. L 60]